MRATSLPIPNGLMWLPTSIFGRHFSGLGSAIVRSIRTLLPQIWTNREFPSMFERMHSSAQTSRKTKGALAGWQGRSLDMQFAKAGGCDRTLLERFACGFPGILHADRGLLTALFRVLHCDLGTLLRPHIGIDTRVVDALACVFSPLGDILASIFSAFGNVLAGILRALANAFAGVFCPLYHCFVSPLEGVFGAIRSLHDESLRILIDAFHDTADSVNDVSRESTVHADCQDDRDKYRQHCFELARMKNHLESPYV